MAFEFCVGYYANFGNCNFISLTVTMKYYILEHFM